MMKDTATPASTSRSALVECVMRATPSTTMVATSAPAKASSGTVSRPRNKPV